MRKLGSCHRFGYTSPIRAFFLAHRMASGSETATQTPLPHGEDGDEAELGSYDRAVVELVGTITVVLDDWERGT
jgi:hypothetical protein